MLYEFINDRTGETVEVIQDINEEHVYEANGEKWRRVFNAQIIPKGIAIDPFNSKQFVEKTRGAGTVGDLIDRSKELSEMRAAKNGGVDPVRQQRDKEYSDKRGGRVAPKNIKELASLV